MKLSDAQKQHVRELCAALRSGAYEQARGRLAIQAGDGFRYCCLGVGCEVALRHGVGHRISTAYYNDATSPGSTLNPDKTLVLPWVIKDFFGFDSADPGIDILCSQIPARHCASWCEDCRTGERNETCDNVVGVAATHANDDFKLMFAQIADGFERRYLGGIDGE